MTTPRSEPEPPLSCARWPIFATGRPTVAGEAAQRDRLTPLEFGIDRSNMATQWTLAPPHEPDVSPFLASDYNKPGNFEARRVAVLDGIARVRAQWFRDGFGKGSPDLLVDLVKLVHARGMKMLAVFGATPSDFRPGAYLSKAQSGCQRGTYPLRSIWPTIRSASRPSSRRCTPPARPSKRSRSATSSISTATMRTIRLAQNGPSTNGNGS